ncbi:uncharacterized protein H6S33_004457 [Morchella sextelata]|uniref:uncharacterized protein n=1 Tax=Morchella sextelata TaxID=1174677 RepID=UPI001D044605|nr:uncharacterized protein H6S33_004457 [Morchella sextelata]KAH0606000.1 hypothetical protein H6S33_004457 [Morchella sextelata]
MTDPFLAVLQGLLDNSLPVAAIGLPNPAKEITAPDQSEKRSPLPFASTPSHFFFFFSLGLLGRSFSSYIIQHRSRLTHNLPHHPSYLPASNNNRPSTYRKKSEGLGKIRLRHKFQSKTIVYLIADTPVAITAIYVLITGTCSTTTLAYTKSLLSQQDTSKRATTPAHPQPELAWRISLAPFDSIDPYTDPFHLVIHLLIIYRSPDNVDVRLLRVASSYSNK